MSGLSFDPTRVPAGTVQDMAKRLSKHPSIAGVSLSKCQEIMARTFGHASFHALKKVKKPNLARQALDHTRTRILLYTLMGSCLDARVDPLTSLGWIEEIGRRGNHWALADLAAACRQACQAGSQFSGALQSIGSTQMGPECFLIARFEDMGCLAEGVKEAMSYAQEAGHQQDLAWLSGGTA